MKTKELKIGYRALIIEFETTGVVLSRQSAHGLGVNSRLKRVQRVTLSCCVPGRSLEGYSMHMLKAVSGRGSAARCSRCHLNLPQNQLLHLRSSLARHIVLNRDGGD